MPRGGVLITCGKNTVQVSYSKSFLKYLTRDVLFLSFSARIKLVPCVIRWITLFHLCCSMGLDPKTPVASLAHIIFSTFSIFEAFLLANKYCANGSPPSNDRKIWNESIFLTFSLTGSRRNYNHLALQFFALQCCDFLFRRKFIW